MRLNIIDALFQPHARCLQAAIFRIATDTNVTRPPISTPSSLPRFSTLLMWQKMSGPPPPSGCRKPYPLTENHFTHRPCDRPSSTTSNLLRNLQPVNIGASASTPMTVHAKSALSIMAPTPSCGAPYRAGPPRAIGDSQESRQARHRSICARQRAVLAASTMTARLMTSESVG
jgi:hypothetical protein